MPGIPRRENQFELNRKLFIPSKKVRDVTKKEKKNKHFRNYNMFKLNIIQQNWNQESITGEEEKCDNRKL